MSEVVWVMSELNGTCVTVACLDCGRVVGLVVVATCVVGLGFCDCEWFHLNEPVKTSFGALCMLTWRTLSALLVAVMQILLALGLLLKVRTILLRPVMSMDEVGRA